jgi:AAA15 family ATPase/GTPase
MIINFAIQNFGSVKDKQTLSFEANKTEHLEDTYIINVGGMRLLKLILIYGSNASGKTTILKALDFLRDIVIMPNDKKTDELDFEPFLFDADTPAMTSKLEIEFIHEEIKYLYQVEFIKKAIVSEELYFYNPNKANLYKRRTDLSNQYTDISFGSKIKIDKAFENALEANTLWNNTVLGGYLKTNIDFKELNPVIKWFRNYLRPMVAPKTSLDSYVIEKISEGKINRNDVIEILKKADFHISDIVIKEKEEKIPPHLLEFIQKEFARKGKIKQMSEEDEKYKLMSLIFEHTVNNKKYSLDFREESEGTKRYFGYAGILSEILRNQGVLPVDELESSLHPDLYEHFILTFLMNAKQSQIIATTHYREILNNKDVFRNDAVWFTDKDKSCSTELYSLADFNSSVIRDSTNVLNAYKSGKLGATPNPDDTYVELNE